MPDLQDALAKWEAALPQLGALLRVDATTYELVTDVLEKAAALIALYQSQLSEMHTHEAFCEMVAAATCVHHVGKGSNP